MTEQLLTVQDLTTWIQTDQGVVRAVDGVSFSIPRGETFALVGESGCGKSMTALSIMQLVPKPAARIVSGSIRMNGQDLLQWPEVKMRTVRGRRIAMIFQEPMTSLNPVMTIGGQIQEAIRRHQNLKGKPARARSMELLEQVGIPDPAKRFHEFPHQLSGGMKQRIMIAMALSGEPELLIADEPTTALDVTIQAQILDLLKNLQERTGMSILLITHDLGVVSEIAHRVAVMYAGQIVETAGRQSFFSEPRHPYSRKLFDSLPTGTKRAQPLAVIAGLVPSLTQTFPGCRFASRCHLAWETCQDTPPLWIETTPDEAVRCHLFDPQQTENQPAGETTAAAPSTPRPPAEQPKDEVLLKVNGLKVHFPIHRGLFKRVVGYVKAVDGVSLQIRQGQTLALVGESGCGKTTTGKGILQLVRPTAGQARYGNVDLTSLSAAALRPWRAELQIIFQDPYASLNPRIQISEIIEEGMIALEIGQTRRERQERILELLEQVGLSPDVLTRYPHEFSGGQRQRISIARALAVNPKLIICDEPTSALDLSVQAQILNLLKELQDRLGLSYLFITHNLSVVEYLAHEIAVMYLGRIVEYGSVQEILENPRHPYTRALLSAVPVLDPKSQREIIRLEGDPPSPINPPAGCHFHPRCPEAMPDCRKDYPDSFQITRTHSTRCLLYDPAQKTIS